MAKGNEENKRMRKTKSEKFFAFLAERKRQRVVKGIRKYEEPDRKISLPFWRRGKDKRVVKGIRKYEEPGHEISLPFGEREKTKGCEKTRKPGGPSHKVSLPTFF